LILLAIAVGPTVGGLLFDSTGYSSTFMESAIALLFAALRTFRLHGAHDRG
jgi:predicted MFS family arabinose efflux permease